MRLLAETTVCASYNSFRMIDTAAALRLADIGTLPYPRLPYPTAIPAFPGLQQLHQLHYHVPFWPTHQFVSRVRVLHDTHPPTLSEQS